MTSIKPILFEGREIIPLQFLKAVLAPTQDLLRQLRQQWPLRLDPILQ
jgi:saccharopine dehydrogenase-like NADP-dependent oxidoreductase